MRLLPPSSLLLLTPFIASPFVSASCSHGTTLSPFLSSRSSSISRRDDVSAIPAPTFGYDATFGPMNWANLDPKGGDAYKMCAEGKHQSPIVLNTEVEGSGIEVLPVGQVKLKFGNEYWNGTDMEFPFENLGTTIEVIAKGRLENFKLGKDGKPKVFEMKQFHFHTPSEHRLNDEYHPMEVHFVFQAADLSIAVYGFLITLSPFGGSHPLLNHVLSSVTRIPHHGNETMLEPAGKMSEALTELEKHVMLNPTIVYSGSLTTPPCTESVSWHISSTPLPLDVTLYNAAKKVIKFNSRGTQNNLGEANLMQVAADKGQGK